MRSTRRELLFAIPGGLALAGCGLKVNPGPMPPTSPVIIALDLIDVALTGGAAVLNQMQPSPGLQVAIQIIQAGADFVSKSIAELESTDSTAAKIQAIVAASTGVTSLALPPGTSQTIVAVVNSVVPLILDFVKQLQAANPPSLALTNMDRARLGLMKGHATATRQRMAMKLAANQK